MPMESSVGEINVSLREIDSTHRGNDLRPLRETEPFNLKGIDPFLVLKETNVTLPTDRRFLFWGDELISVENRIFA